MRRFGQNLTFSMWNFEAVFPKASACKVITMEFGQLLDCTMMDICLFQERAWCCSYAAPEWLEWRRGAVLLQLERLQVPGGGRSNRDGHLEDQQLCPGKKPLKVLKRNLSQTVKVQSFMCSYGRVPMVSEAFFACNPVNVRQPDICIQERETTSSRDPRHSFNQHRSRDMPLLFHNQYFGGRQGRKTGIPEVKIRLWLRLRGLSIIGYVSTT